MEELFLVRSRTQMGWEMYTKNENGSIFFCCEFRINI